MCRSSILIVLITIIHFSSNCQVSEELSNCFESAYELNDFTAYSACKLEVQKMVELDQFKEIEEFDEIIRVVRPFRDIPFTQFLFDSKQILIHNNEGEEDCSCGKHKNCHE